MSVTPKPHPRDAEPLPPRGNGDLTTFINRQGFTIRDWREAYACDKCGHCSWNPDTDEDDTVVTPCDHGCCHVYRCVECGHYNSGFGIAGCPCDDGI